MIGKELMTFKKYVEAYSDKLYCEDTIAINGTFKEIPSREIIKNDIFEAHKLSKSTIEEIYKTYLEWFNYTRSEREEEREFVSVKQTEEDKEEK